MKIDCIGDVHGCFNELQELLIELGYQFIDNQFIHPKGRIPIFLGDITDRGPRSLATINIVTQMVENKNALYVPGNHCNKLYRYFLGNKVQLTHGLETTVDEYLACTRQKQKEIKQSFMKLYEGAPLYLTIPELNVVIAHAGIKESLIGRHDKKAKKFVLYGDINGKFHPDGRPIRNDWAQDYRGDQLVVYGHTPVITPRMLHQTINIDTGCVFGNALTAFRLPEKTIVQVPSMQPFNKEKFTTFPSSYRAGDDTEK